MNPLQRFILLCHKTIGDNVMGEISFKAVKKTKYTNASLVESHISAIIFASQDNL